MQSSPTRNISLVPSNASVATTSFALASHPSQPSSMMGGARALLSLKEEEEDPDEGAGGPPQKRKA